MGELYLQDRGVRGGDAQYSCKALLSKATHLGIALGYPAFVTEIDAENREVTLAPKAETFKSEITVSDLVFGALFERRSGEITATVKIRYAAKPAPCRVVFSENGARVYFDTPERTPAKGQSAVFYDGETVLVGGTMV